MAYRYSNVSGIDPALDAAYRATTYVVELEQGNIAIRIDQPTPALDALLASMACRDWAFISACNPDSQALPESKNRERHAQLLAAVDLLGLAWYPGRGIPDHPGWQAETSLLILGLPAEKAIALAAKFGQKAIVTGSIGLPARLCYVYGNSS